MTSRCKFVVLSAFIVLGFVLGSTGFSFAAEAVKEASVSSEGQKAVPAPAAADDSKNWMQRCQDVKKSETETTQYCEVFQRLSVKAKDSEELQRVIELAVGYPDGVKEKARGVLILPLGILVDQPVELDVDDKKQISSDVAYCQPDGCYAPLVFTDSALEKIGKSKTVNVKMKAMNGQAIKFNLVPAGFKEALAGIQKK